MVHNGVYCVMENKTQKFHWKRKIYLLQISQNFGQRFRTDLLLQLLEVACPTTHLDLSLHPPNVHHLFFRKIVKCV